MKIRTIVNTSEQKRQFIKQAQASANRSRPIEILCIAGTAPLTERLQWLSEETHRFTHPLTINITSVEASIYQSDSHKAAVNHNSKIDPNLESQLENEKMKLIEMGCDISHQSLCSEINGTKITRSTSASVSIDNGLKTDLEDALQKRFPEETHTQIGKLGTTLRQLPPQLYGIHGTTPVLSRSTFCHDHKALFLHQHSDDLKDKGVLKEMKRLGIATSIGRIYFDATQIDKSKIKDFEKSCRRQLSTQHHKLDPTYPTSIDTRWIIDPKKVGEFNNLYLSFIKSKHPTLGNGITVISDMGHGYIDNIASTTTTGQLNSLDSDPCNPFKLQDSDDYIVFLELLKQNTRSLSINRVVSDDCLNMRALFEVHQSLKHEVSANIHVNTSANRALPFANRSHPIDHQIKRFSETASLRLSRLSRGNINADRALTSYTHFLKLIHLIGTEIITLSSNSALSNSAKQLLDTHQSCLNALSMHEKVKNKNGAIQFNLELKKQEKTLSTAWTQYCKRKKTKKQRYMLFTAINMVSCTSAYWMKNQPGVAAAIIGTGMALSIAMPRILEYCDRSTTNNASTEYNIKIKFA